MGFTDAFNSSLRAGAQLQNILYQKEARDTATETRQATEGIRTLQAVKDTYGDDMTQYPQEAFDIMTKTLNMDPKMMGQRPGGTPTVTGFHHTPNGVAAMVSVDDGNGNVSEGPITRKGTSDGADEVVTMTSLQAMIDQIQANEKQYEVNARGKSAEADKQLQTRNDARRYDASFEIVNNRINGGSAETGGPLQVPNAPVQPAQPAIEDGPARGLQAGGSTPVNPPAVTSPATPPPEFKGTPAAPAPGLQYTGPAFRPELDDAIAGASETNGVDPSLVRAVVHTESSGNAAAYNDKAQATGLMQMTPIAVKEVNNQYGTNYTMADMKDPSKNLDAGTKLLAYYKKKTGSDEQALAAYNGGITRLRKNGGDISKMPPETRDYVGKILAMVTGSGEANAAEVPAVSPGPQGLSAAPPGLNTTASAQTPVASLGKSGRTSGGRNKAHDDTPLKDVERDIRLAEENLTAVEAKGPTRARGGAKATTTAEAARAKLARLRADREQIVNPQPSAEEVAAAENATAEQKALAKHESDVQGFIDSFSPKDVAEKSVVEEMKGTPAPRSEAEAVAAAETVQATKPAQKWTEEQRKALYTLHRLNPTQFPLGDVVEALKTGRMSRTKWATTTNAAGQMIQVSDDGQTRTLAETPENKLFRQAKMQKASYDANISRVQDQQQLEQGRLAQTKARTDFIVEQGKNITGEDPQAIADYRDKVNTTVQTMGLSLDDQSTPTALNTAARVQKLYNEDNGPAWYNLWMKDEPYNNDYSFGMAVQNMPNAPYDPRSPDDDEVLKAGEYYKTEYLDPVMEQFPNLSKQQQTQATYMATHLEKNNMSHADAIRVAGSVVGHARFATVGEAIKMADRKMAEYVAK